MTTLTPQEALQALQDGKKVECLIEGSKIWHNVLLFRTDALVNTNNKFRLSPEMITIKGVSFPKPESEPLEKGTEYWVMNPVCESNTASDSCCWDDDDFDELYLHRGLIHLSQENAIAHAKALIKLSGGNVDE